MDLPLIGESRRIRFALLEGFFYGVLVELRDVDFHIMLVQIHDRACDPVSQLFAGLEDIGRSSHLRMECPAAAGS